MGVRQEIEALEEKYSKGPGKSRGFVVGSRNKGNTIGREMGALLVKHYAAAGENMGLW
jgi:hypothetical protein